MTFEVAVQRLRVVADTAARLPVRLPNGVPDLAAARVRLAEGIPALAGEPLIDWPTLATTVRALGGDIAALGAALGESTVCDMALAGAWDAVGGDADREATITLLDYAARPALRAGFAATCDVIAACQWLRGTCPACGALPLLAELHAEKEGNSRILRCGRCTAAWSFARLGCPACGERDHTKLRYLHVDGEVDHRRVECCTSCGFYVKAVATLDPLSVEKLLDVDLETIALDTLALDAGYHRRGTA